MRAKDTRTIKSVVVLHMFFIYVSCACVLCNLRENQHHALQFLFALLVLLLVELLVVVPFLPAVPLCCVQCFVSKSLLFPDGSCCAIGFCPSCLDFQTDRGPWCSLTFASCFDCNGCYSGFTALPSGPGVCPGLSI